MEKIIEITSCVIQLGILAFLAVWSARQTREPWLFRLITCAFGCYFLGTLFWTFHILVTGDWPRGFSASDLSFIGYYCFFLAAALGLKEKWTDGQREAAKRYRITALLGTAVVIALHIAYVLLAGGLANNIIFCAALSSLFYHALLGFLAGGAYRRYHGAVLAAFALELVIFLVSSLGWEVGYIIFTCIQMAAWFFIIPAAKEGAKA